MIVYVKWIYPHVEAGRSHARPGMPLCFTKLHESSVTWNIHSLNDDDRAEFWEADELELDVLHTAMTALEVETEVYGIDGKDAWILLNSPDV